MGANGQLVTYISSEAYANIIASTIKEQEIMSLNPAVSNDFFLNKYVKENLADFTNLDKIIIDLSALKDLDEEVISALDGIRYLDGSMQIIIFAPNRREGDPLLTQIFQMGIYNIICSEDYQVIGKELAYCLTTGKGYKDAVAFKKESTERVVVKTEVRQTVNKILIGITCSQRRIGGSHNSIQLAATLRKKGYMVAVVECNEYHPVFEILRNEHHEKLLEDHFSIEGLDFYPFGEEALANALAKTYNFIICDFGCYEECDKVTYNKCHVRLILTGSCAWELDALNIHIFPFFTREFLKEACFLFLFADESRRKAILEGMEDLKTYFLEYGPDMFAPCFSAADQIFAEYLQEKVPEKKGFFRRKKGVKR